RGAGAGRGRRRARSGGGARHRVHARAGPAVPGVRLRPAVGDQRGGGDPPAHGLGHPGRRGDAGGGRDRPGHRGLGGVHPLAAGVDRGLRGGAVSTAPRRPAPPQRVLAWLRNGWRQLTSMRTALVLLFLLAMAAVPGSLLPQRTVNGDRVAAYYQEHPQLAPVLDRLGGFDVYG